MSAPFPAAPDPSQPFRLAEDVWWVGCYQPDDGFQAHAYLVVRGDQSALIDPGGRRTFPETLRKIETILPFSQIRYFICQHQDPDITASLVEIDRLVTRPDAMIVAHWRAQMLMKEYGLALPYLCVEHNGWTLDLGGRRLRFVFTPYAHFPGAFCTFDETSGVLFSSDLFGGFTDGFQLFATGESYFESMRPFHEHYIASNEVLVHAVEKVRQLPLSMIAPQHGSIIPAKLAPYLLDRLSTLDCGLFLLTQGSADIHRLTLLSKTLRDFTQAMVVYRDFREVIDTTVPLMRRLLPAEELTFVVLDDRRQVVLLSPESRYHGQAVTLAERTRELLFPPQDETGNEPVRLTYLTLDETLRPEPYLLLPLSSEADGRTSTLALIRLSHPVFPDEQARTLLERLSAPLAVAVEREMMLRHLDEQREQMYQRSIRDPMTGLYNRAYMQDVAQRLFSLHDRDIRNTVSLAVADIDHFKSINDQFGHNQGDLVLKRVAAALREAIREEDLAVRLGGEEFAVFVSGRSAEKVAELGERLRLAVESLDFSTTLGERQITASLGVAIRNPRETLTELIHRADLALYQAKRAGRNRVEMA